MAISVCPGTRRIANKRGDIEFGGQEWGGHFAFPGDIVRPTFREPGVLDAIILSHLVHSRNAIDLPERTCILSAPGLSEFRVEALAGFGPVLPCFPRLKPLLRPFESVFETWAIH